LIDVAYKNCYNQKRRKFTGGTRMENSNEKKSQPYNVDGYNFYTEKDVKLAELEHKKIEYLKKKIDYSDPDNILKVYDRAISERIFKTPIGIDFLREIQVFLMECPDIPDEAIQAIPLVAVYDSEVREHSAPARNRVKPSEKKKKKDSKSQALFISVLINIVLVVAVFAMFIITLNSEQPNILNYERAITNRYASWEQQLTEREKAVREKERELNIEIE